MYNIDDFTMYGLYEDVYPPSEDSYLTVDAATQTITNEKILKITRLKYHRANLVEVGSGTGVVTILVLKEFKKITRNLYAIATDIKYTAAKCTYENIRKNNLDSMCDVVQTDTLSCIKNRFTVHILISNPPYLPCEDEIEPNYCGGADGRLVIDKVLHEFRERAFILILTQSSLSDVSKTVKRLMDCADVILLRKLHMLFEDIVTLLAIRLVPHRNHTINH